MAELNCPMCGRNNPEELEACRFCGARLLTFETESEKNFKVLTQKEEEDPSRRLPDPHFTPGMGKGWNIDTGEPIGPGRIKSEREGNPGWIKRLRKNGFPGRLFQRKGNIGSEVNAAAENHPEIVQGIKGQKENLSPGVAPADEKVPMQSPQGEEGENQEGLSRQQTEVNTTGDWIADLFPPSLSAGEDLLSYYQKAPIHFKKVEITESQQFHVNILENMLDGFDPTASEPPKVKSAPGRGGRLFVAFLLLSAMTVTILLGDQVGLASSPQAGKQVLAFHGVIERVPAGLPVLVAVEYQPSVSGEMGLVATNVLARLMQKNINIALVSTVLSGPAMGMDLLEKARKAASINEPGIENDYQFEKRTVNFGYLPGGTAALIELVTMPQKAVFFGQDVLRDGIPVWENPALNNVTKLSEFGLVIVLCENLDYGKAWIEQVQPKLGRVPMVIITSSQAGPLFYPYLAGGQLSTILSGFTDGYEYGQISRLSKGSGNTRAAYQAGVVIAIFFIIFSPAMSGIQAILLKRKRSVKEHGNDH